MGKDGQEVVPIAYDKMEREYFVSAQEMQKIFKLDSSNCYKHLRNAVRKFLKASITLKGDGKNDFTVTNVCSQAKYLESQGRIKVIFTPEIMPHLEKVQKKFVLYDLKEVTPFKSFASIRLYELLKEFQHTGWVVKSLSRLKSVFVVEGKYKDYKNFKMRVLRKAVLEINEIFPKIGLSFVELREAKNVEAIKFLFSPFFFGVKDTHKFMKIEEKIAINLFNAGTPLSRICDATGISAERLNDLCK